MHITKTNNFAQVMQDSRISLSYLNGGGADYSNHNLLPRPLIFRPTYATDM